MLSLGAVFGLFARFYYWLPKMSGRMYNEFLGQLHFWVFFVGVNIIFFPMHFLGLQGMPRRIVDYPDAFSTYNHLSSVDYAIAAASTLIFAANIIHASIAGRRAPDNPWGSGATTLECTLSSPPPYHQFETLPRIE